VEVLLVVIEVILAVIVQCVKHCNDGTISMKEKHMLMRDGRKAYIYLMIKTSKRRRKRRKI